MKLYLIRHAESLRNLGKEHDRLSETGIEQAKRLGLFLKNKHVDYVYCSTMTRTKETCAFILPSLKNVKKITYSDLIREQNVGVFEEKPQKEYSYHILDLKDKGKDILKYRPEGGETLLEVEKRTQRFIEELKKKHKKEDHIAIVSHAGYLRFFILRLLNLSLDEAKYFTIHNASLSTFELDKNFNVKEYEIDDFKHLLMFSSYERKRIDKV